MDRRFQDCFRHQEPVGDMLSQFHQQEYQENFWWLRRKPILSEIREPVLDDARLLDIGSSGIMSSSKVCSESERGIAYAFHELMGQERLEMQKHVRSCSICLNQVLDIRIVQQEAQQEGRQPVTLAIYLSESGKSGLVLTAHRGLVGKLDKLSVPSLQAMREALGTAPNYEIARPLVSE